MSNDSLGHEARMEQLCNDARPLLTTKPEKTETILYKQKTKNTMSITKAKKPKKAEPSKPKMIVYGGKGVGKTWTAIEFPDILFCDTEGGANFAHYTDKLEEAGAEYLGVEDGVNDLDFLIQIGKDLLTKDHEYKTWIIDSMSKPWNDLKISEAERLGDKDAFGASNKLPVQKMRKLTNIIEKLDMNVIIICHEKTEYKNGEAVGVTFDCYDKMGYDLNLDGRVTEVGDRRFFTASKSRFKSIKKGVPIEWSMENIKDLIEQDFGKGILTREVKSITLASNESIAEFEKLCGVLQVTDKQLATKLKSQKCESLDELSQELINEWIKSAKTKVSQLTK